MSAKSPGIIIVNSRVEKRNGTLQRFDEKKIITGVMKAGATRKQAESVASNVTARLIDCTTCTPRWRRDKVIASRNLSKMVVSSLSEANKNASERFTNYQKRKYGR